MTIASSIEVFTKNRLEHQPLLREFADVFFQGARELEQSGMNAVNVGGRGINIDWLLNRDADAMVRIAHRKDWHDRRPRCQRKLHRPGRQKNMIAQKRDWHTL